STYDPFGAAHSSTSISAALGMAVARDFKDAENHAIAVIGDGAMSAGMAYEALNNAGALKSDLIVVLNDNAMSIAPPVGGMADYFARLAYEKPAKTFFEELGFEYLGPLDGHDIDALVPVFARLRDRETRGPVLVHVITEKGHGYAPAANAADKGHAVG